MIVIRATGLVSFMFVSAAVMDVVAVVVVNAVVVAVVAVVVVVVVVTSDPHTVQCRSVFCSL
jgi:hypothetical protein